MLTQFRQSPSLNRQRVAACVRHVATVASLLLLSGGAARAQAPAAPSPDLAGIAHVAFRTADLQASLAFYQQLGFVRAFEFTKDGKPTEEFIKINDRQFLELYPQSGADSPVGLMHVCYEAADLEALHAAYVAAGLTPPVVKKAGAGNLLFSLRGPDGSVIEFTQYLPESMHSKDAGLHLGEHRISSQLVGVTVPVHVQDQAAWTELFVQKLHFTPEGAAESARFGVPSRPSLTITLHAAEPQAPAIVRFAVVRLATTAKELRSEGVAFEQQGTTLVVQDPDHNVLEFAVPMKNKH